MKKFEAVILLSIRAMGTLGAVLIHLVWFIAWFLFKLDVNLLTNLVSLEAIFLSIFVMIEQQHHSKRHKKDMVELHNKIDKL